MILSYAFEKKENIYFMLRNGQAYLHEFTWHVDCPDPLVLRVRDLVHRHHVQVAESHPGNLLETSLELDQFKAIALPFNLKALGLLLSHSD